MVYEYAMLAEKKTHHQYEYCRLLHNGIYIASKPKDFGFTCENRFSQAFYFGAMNQ